MSEVFASLGHMVFVLCGAVTTCEKERQRKEKMENGNEKKGILYEHPFPL